MKFFRWVSILFIGIILLFAIWWIPHWQSKESHLSNAVYIHIPTTENEYRHTFVQGLTHLAFFASLWLAWRKLNVLEKHTASTEELQRTTYENKLTDRFYKAVQQLANEHAEVRLGGIYALERMIADSPRDKDTIHEILSAYVRMRSANELKGDALREDLRACLEVLARTSPKKVDLGRVDLSSKNLSHMNLSGFWLANAQLVEADLYHANLKGALLPGVDLRRAELVEAQLQGADLTGANLERANLARARLDGAVLIDANLRGANLRETVGLSRRQLASSIIDETTNLPVEV
jgi:hypothetical protein